MSVKNITVQDAHAQQAEGCTYVDVRSIPEFAQGHPAGAVNVPLLHRDVLAASGYTDVTSVPGGYGGARDPMTGAVRAEGWTPARLPVEVEDSPGTSSEALRTRAGARGE